MTIIATDTQRLSNLIKKVDAFNSPELLNDVVTVNEASATSYPVGTVMGQITASGKYIRSVQTAADGSQNPVAIYIGDSFGNINTVAIAAATDTKVLVLARGKAVVSASALVLDASFTAGALTVAAYASLKAKNILVETTN